MLHVCFSLEISEVLPFFVAFSCWEVDGFALAPGVSVLTFADPLRFSFLTGELWGVKLHRGLVIDL